MWIVAMPFLGMAIVGACLMPGVLWRPDDPHPYDVLVYHLQVPREWYELGRVVGLTHNVFSYFPFNTEMHFLAMMYLKGGPWKGMYAAQFLNVVFAALTVLTIYGSVRKLRPDASLANAIVAGVLTAGIPWIVMPACVAYVEPYMVLMTALSVHWALVGMSRGSPLHAIAQGHTESPRSTFGERFSPWALAGVFAGFAAGAKFTAVAMVLVGLPAACGVVGVLAGFVGRLSGSTDALVGSVFARPKRAASPPAKLVNDGSGEAGEMPRIHYGRNIIIGCVIFFVSGLAALSPWLIRNQIWAGNPVFPLAMRVLGARDFDETQIVRFERAHAATDVQKSLSAKVQAVVHEIQWSWKYGFALWMLALAGWVISARRAEAWALGILTLLMLFTWMFATHLMSRFLVTSIPPAMLLIGLARWGRLLPVVGVIGVVCILCAWSGEGRLSDQLSQAAEKGEQGLFGLDEPMLMIPEIVKEVEDGQRIVAMVGDSQAFLHPSPMSHLRYRTVFDVKTVPGQNPIDAWLGLKAGEARPRDVTVYVDPAELSRLARTYLGIEDLKDEAGDRPYVLSGD